MTASAIYILSPALLSHGSLPAISLTPSDAGAPKTSRTSKLIAHEDSSHFVLNMHALHNAHLLRRILPQELVAPKPLYDDRTTRHYEIATSLQVTQSEKRAHTAANRKATNNAKKSKKETHVPSDGEAPESEGENAQDNEQVGEATSGRKHHWTNI